MQPDPRSQESFIEDFTRFEQGWMASINTAARIEPLGTHSSSSAKQEMLLHTLTLRWLSSFRK